LKTITFSARLGVGRIREESLLHNRFSSPIHSYFANITRFAADDFKPTEQDILRARARTTGVIESKFQVDDLSFTLIDVGGQVRPLFLAVALSRSQVLNVTILFCPTILTAE
jgi:hypothetical protein